MKKKTEDGTLLVIEGHDDIDGDYEKFLYFLMIYGSRTKMLFWQGVMS